ncbi:hypothetical protein M422DRAFT_256417 [Sphaerobolus stellatus SS14]|uniref:Uncharacterized protein n=1 Tax=Sphaerobolus stellatus (strain SS14) TaxID=990650 RepID=A0A0C9VRU4_SPHS4|nr:hypothetical protein M422DRAFT_256417 [Sphaerobolus stellatus SS14]
MPSGSTALRRRKGAKKVVQPFPTQSARPNALPIKIHIPDGFQFNDIQGSDGSHSDSEDEESSEGAAHVFCPEIWHDTIIAMMEHHYCVHPLIPEFSAPTALEFSIGM